jgi:hypothetical protein
LSERTARPATRAPARSLDFIVHLGSTTVFNIKVAKLQQVCGVLIELMIKTIRRRTLGNRAGCHLSPRDALE